MSKSIQVEKKVTIWITIKNRTRTNNLQKAKSGVEPKDALDVCKHIKENCSALELYGLMTIGMRDRDAANNPDFEVN
jgi:uncharacterized pyridoxal phosphate-containing UPF0001 family protein